MHKMHGLHGVKTGRFEVGTNGFGFSILLDYFPEPDGFNCLHPILKNVNYLFGLVH